jgi:hypothetical protein
MMGDNRGMNALFNPYQVSPLLVTEDELQNTIDKAMKIENAKLTKKQYNKIAREVKLEELGTFERGQAEIQRREKMLAEKRRKERGL